MMSEHWLHNYNLLIFDQIDSTNEEAKRLEQAKVEGEFVIWSKSQAKGKGRLGRKWVSPIGNLYLSLLLRPKYDVTTSSQISFVVAVAVGEMIAKFAHSQVAISYKWPNDILLNDKKIAGILLESSIKMHNGFLDWLVVGIGLNVVSSPEQMPYPTSSLQEQNIEIDLNKIVDELMKSFSYWYSLWQNQGFDIIRTKWLERGKALGEVITVSVGKDRISGVFEDITLDGCIKLILPGGQACFVSSGEVFYDINEYNLFK